MKSPHLFSICFLLLALAASQFAPAQAMAVAAIAEKLSNAAADKINETPKVEETGGVRQQALHTGANLASKTLIDKGAAALMTAAAKYPMVAVAAPVALPLAKAVAGAIVLNQIHKTINGMYDKKKNSTMTPEEEQAEKEAREARGEKAKGVLAKVGSFFKKDGAADQEPAAGDQADKKEAATEAKADTEEPKNEKEPQKEEEPKKEANEEKKPEEAEEKKE